LTTNLLAFNSAATVYLVIGSLHEEARLREAYGEEYKAYLGSGVPFYLPSVLEPGSALLNARYPTTIAANSPSREVRHAAP
jgi:hypothetical protein